MTLLDRLAARYGYVRREYPRVDNGVDAVARGQRWEAFYGEVGGLADMLRAMRQEVFEEWANAPFGDRHVRDRMSVKDEAIRDLGARVRTVIETGKVEQHRRAEAEKFAAIQR